MAKRVISLLNMVAMFLKDRLFKEAMLMRERFKVFERFFIRFLVNGT